MTLLDQLQNQTRSLLETLVACPSVTPDDANCQQIIAEQLQSVGFATESLRFGEVDNLWATHGEHGPLLVFAGHTDVVPTGDLNEWQSNPFQPSEREGYLYGRGCADMKSGLSAMIVAAMQYAKVRPEHAGRIGFLITSDEEGIATDGTVRVMEALAERGEQINYAIVGEASSESELADRVMIGRRGSLSGNLRVIGKQGHIAYPHTAINPIHQLAPALAELAETVWDEGNEHFPPTSFQCSNLNAGVGANNVIPGVADLQFNFRFCTESDPDDLKARVIRFLDKYGFDYELTWNLSGLPFITNDGELTQVVSDTIQDHRGQPPQLFTGGGTSDARFIAPSGAQVVELGPVGKTAHKIDERVRIEDLGKLSAIYLDIIGRLLDNA